MTSSSEEHQEILNEVRQVRKDLTWHIENDHDFMYRSDIENLLAGQTALMEAMAEQQEIIAEVVLGEKKTDFDGQVYREGGMKAIVDQINGHGLSGLFDISWSKLLAFLGTIVGSATGIIIAIIETGG